MSNAISGQLEELSHFEFMPNLRLPVPDWAGSKALALGMMYYKFIEHFR